MRGNKNFSRKTDASVATEGLDFSGKNPTPTPHFMGAKKFAKAIGVILIFVVVLAGGFFLFSKTIYADEGTGPGDMNPGNDNGGGSTVQWSGVAAQAGRNIKVTITATVEYIPDNNILGCYMSPGGKPYAGYTSTITNIVAKNGSTRVPFSSITMTNDGKNKVSGTVSMPISDFTTPGQYTITYKADRNHFCSSTSSSQKNLDMTIYIDPAITIGQDIVNKNGGHVGSIHLSHNSNNSFNASDSDICKTASIGDTVYTWLSAENTAPSSAQPITTDLFRNVMSAAQTNCGIVGGSGTQYKDYTNVSIEPGHNSNSISGWA